MKDNAERGWRAGEVGILTFHCSDNFGAMLQAYALKHRLRTGGVAADIVRYEPPYMTGRHWLVPYVPKERKRLSGLAHMGYGLLYNLWNIRVFAARRTKMRRFRTKWLIDRGQPRALFLPGLKRLPYRCYVVGSDQIWNPDITLGLRPAYFGAFEGKHKERVVAYAASLGGSGLPDRYSQQFSELIRGLDRVSVRESGAVAYVQRFFPGKVEVVLDPVFFLGKEEWERVKNAPNRGEYILLYGTERNQAMTEYARELSQKTGLPVVELRAGAESEGPFTVDASAGPAEFLGYVHHARYVVTNSFHAAAFSIIFEKQFLVFAHSTVNERLASVLALHGLEGRLCREGGDIDAPIDWPAVRSRTEEAAGASLEFLMDSVTGGTK